MKKFFELLKRNWKVNVFWLIGSIAFGIGVFCLYFFLNGATLKASCDACTISAIVLICVGLLMLVARFGAFDTFAYGFKQLGGAMFSKKGKIKQTYTEYIDHKKEIRSTASIYFSAVIFAGILFLIALIVLEIIFHSIYK